MCGRVTLFEADTNGGGWESQKNGERIIAWEYDTNIINAFYGLAYRQAI